MSIKEIDMSIARFWVQIHNLPLDYMIVENAPIIGSHLGQVIKFEESLYNGVLLRSFL